MGLLCVTVLLTLALGYGQARAASGSLSGALVYSDMSPASRVLVFVIPAHVTGVVQPYETLTNAQGEWSLSSMPPGEYTVAMIVAPASGTRETRSSQTVDLAEGQSIALGTINVGAPTVSEAKTRAEVEGELAKKRAEVEAELTEVGALTVVVKTAEGRPAEGALLSIQGVSGGSTSSVPSSGVVLGKVRPGPVTLSVTDTPPDSATQVSVSAQATIVANVMTNVTLMLPASSPLAVPVGITAHNSERDLSYLNVERARWGLPAGLTLNPVWSQACASHDAYLADNKRLEHPEDSSLPGASPGGAWAGLHSILSGGGWASEANPWEDAPIHLDQLYTPDLMVVGIDESRGVACTTTWPGIGPSLQPGGTILTYPGDGASGFPPSELADELPFTPGKFVGIREGAITGRELFVYEEPPGECSVLSCTSTKAPSLESATLTGPAGRVEVRTIGGETNEVGPYLSGAIIIPVESLAPNTTYTAEVTLAPNGELPAEQHSWTFHTGLANPGGVWPLGRRSPREALPLRRRISKLRVTPRAFTDGRRHSGARIIYLDSGSGTTSFVVYRSGPGVLVGAQCAPTASAPRSKRCSRLSRIYSFSRRDRVGRNSVALTGRYGRRALAAGDYRLIAIVAPGLMFATGFSVT